MLIQILLHTCTLCAKKQVFDLVVKNSAITQNTDWFGETHRHCCSAEEGAELWSVCVFFSVWEQNHLIAISQCPHRDIHTQSNHTLAYQGGGNICNMLNIHLRCAYIKMYLFGSICIFFRVNIFLTFVHSNLIGVPVTFGCNYWAAFGVISILSKKLESKT